MIEELSIELMYNPPERRFTVPINDENRWMVSRVESLLRIRIKQLSHCFVSGDHIWSLEEI